MSRENDFYARMIADATLVATLTGGIYKRESVGVEGITRETTPAAFSTYLRPCALVKQRANIPDGAVPDEGAQYASAQQVVEVWLYDDSGAGYTAIDAAKRRLYALFESHRFTGASACAPIRWAGGLDRERDPGPLKGACMARMDFRVVAIEKAA